MTQFLTPGLVDTEHYYELLKLYKRSWEVNIGDEI